MFWQKHDIERGSVVYLKPEVKQKTNIWKKSINAIVQFVTFRQYTPFPVENRITGSSTIRRVVGMPGDTIYMRDYILYVKPDRKSYV